MVSYSEITEDVEIKKRLIEEEMIVTTKRGRLVFFRFTQNVEEAKSAINGKLSDGGGGEE